MHSTVIYAILRGVPSAKGRLAWEGGSSALGKAR